MSTSIKVDQVSMMFNMSSEKVDNIKEYFIRVLKHKIAVEPFWALQDVSFELKRGDSLGVIGLNGSGKSTLLKLVSGILKPTKGTVETYGSIAPLIELGAGFDPELSAVENIYLNGAVLGYSHAYMEERVDSILDFAELEEFRNIAIKNFSSGMTARLGFAIATMNVPDILILDEILGIKDLRSDKRIDFVGGIRGLGELKKRVDSGEMKMALALYPVSMKQLMDIADTGNIMPPKTTWFEPKLRSGLVIHKLE